MSNSTLNFSATLPPFIYTSGYNTNFSNSNLSATGNLAINTGKDSVTGAPTTTVSSSIDTNGVNYAETGASINGNVLTVNYQSSTAPDTISANINGSGVNFSPQNSVINGKAVTTAYSTNPNGNFNLAIPNAATSTAVSDTGQTIVLKSLAVVGNSLTATYQLTSDLPNNVTLAPSSAPPPQTAIVTAQEPSSVNLGHRGATFRSGGLQTIGDVLAASNGINFNNTISNSIQPPGLGPSTGFSASNATLAAVLNPNSNLSPSASLDVTNFIDTGLNSFSTSNSTAANNSSSTFTSQNNTGNSFTSTGGNNSSSNQASSANTNTPTGIYNAVANASASNIRGTGVNTVA